MGFFSFFKKKEPPKQPTREELLKNMAEESYDFYKIYDERERQLLYDNIPNSKHLLLDEDTYDLATNKIGIDMDSEENSNALFVVSISVQGLYYEMLEYLAEICSETEFLFEDLCYIAEYSSDVEELKNLYQLYKTGFSFVDYYNNKESLSKEEILFFLYHLNGFLI